MSSREETLLLEPERDREPSSIGVISFSSRRWLEEELDEEGIPSSGKGRMKKQIH